jgi:hypothetical protein
MFDSVANVSSVDQSRLSAFRGMGLWCVKLKSMSFGNLGIVLQSIRSIRTIRDPDCFLMRTYYDYDDLRFPESCECRSNG